MLSFTEEEINMPRNCFIFLILILYLATVNAATLIVTNTNDSGAGSLRQTIQDANDNDESDTIVFNIPATDGGYDAETGVWRIEPLSEFPMLSADKIEIDGTTQADFIGGDPNPEGPEIVIDGHQAGEAEGIYLRGNNKTLKCLVIHRFMYDLITISGDSNKVLGCYLGPDATGKNRLESNSSGLSINGSFNEIGGIAEEDRNVVCGNLRNGIQHIKGNYNKIIGNFIGVTSTGSDTLSNSDGIRISNARHLTLGPKNVISGNDGEGIIFQQDSDSCIVFGNLIGTDYTGKIALGNTGDGISFSDGSDYNVVGNSSQSENRNIISANQGDGIDVGGDYNVIVGNYIGTDVSGEFALPNAYRGINIGNYSNFNIVGGENPDDGNLVSGNEWDGVRISGESTRDNVILNNYIGTSADGLLPIPNKKDGVVIEYSATKNIVGPGNLIAFNLANGVSILNNAIMNTITQNSIHSNKEMGIEVSQGGNNNLASPEITRFSPVIGTTFPNAIVEIFSTAEDEGEIYEATVIADENGDFSWSGTPLGPFVTATATDADGNTSAFSRARNSGNYIVTTTADAGEGSLRDAMEKSELSSGSDRIYFNIPTDDAGFDGKVWRIKPLTSNLPGLHDGGLEINGFSQTENQGDTNPNGPEIFIDGSEHTGDYRVGIGVYSSDNVISGLGIVGFREMGIEIYYDGSENNQIYGNYIGIDADGKTSIENGTGISIGGNAKHNIIGGASPEKRNVISGSRHHGIACAADSNIFIGNYIGTDATGMTACGNQSSGVRLESTSKDIQIGGILTGEGNVISGNGYCGIELTGSETQYHVIQGNIIGLNASASDTLANELGIYLGRGTNNIIIGGSEVNAGNVISGNKERGILIDESFENQIIGNKIGTDSSGEAVFPNKLTGIFLRNGAQLNQIGPDNIICNNEGPGIELTQETTHYNRITQNSIFNNKNKGISLFNGGNGEIAAPVINGLSPVQGTATANSTVEIFSDDSDEGRIYEATVTADGSGNFSWSGVPQGPSVTATATDDSGNTSEFSTYFVVSVEDDKPGKPSQFSLSQNFPNPFNPATTIEYQVKVSGHVTLKVFNMLGEEVRTLVDSPREAGFYRLKFDAKDLPSGIYFYQFQCRDFQAVRKFMLVK